MAEIGFLQPSKPARFAAGIAVPATAVLMLLISEAPAALVCPGTPPQQPASGVCAVTAGNAALLLQGNVLAPGDVFENGQVLIGADGDIDCVACDCSDEPEYAVATRVVCPAGVISPGLIDARNLLSFAQNLPAPYTGERYEHRHDWRLGLRGHSAISATGNASLNQRRYGELRALLAGVTSLNSSSSAASPGLVRNLDGSADR